MLDFDDDDPLSGFPQADPLGADPEVPRGKSPPHYDLSLEAPADAQAEAALMSETPDACEELDKEVARAMKVTDTRTCPHNQWVLKYRAKRWYVLGCRVCGAFWKTRLKKTEKCGDFFMGNCRLGDRCPCPHVYATAPFKAVAVQVALRTFRTQMGTDTRFALKDSDEEKFTMTPDTVSTLLAAAEETKNEEDEVVHASTTPQLPERPAAAFSATQQGGVPPIPMPMSVMPTVVPLVLGYGHTMYPINASMNTFTSPLQNMA